MSKRIRKDFKTGVEQVGELFESAVETHMGTLFINLLQLYVQVRVLFIMVHQCSMYNTFLVFRASDITPATQQGRPGFRRHPASCGLGVYCCCGVDRQT